MNYTLPYIVSFMSIDYNDPGKIIGLIIFLIWMFWISYKSGQIILNPVLIILDWRLYEISYSFPGSTDTIKGLALAKGRIETNKHYKQTPIHDILVIRNTKQQEAQ